MALTVVRKIRWASFGMLAVGAAFTVDGTFWVKTKPSEFRGEAFNAVGLGHDGITKVPHTALVPILDIVASEVEA